MRTFRSHLVNFVTALLLIVGGGLGPWAASVHATGDSVDEIHYVFGSTSDSVIFDWHGQEQNIYYSLDTSYDHSAVALDAPITPVNESGPFRQIELTGLQPGATYNYKIGIDGPNHTFQTTPTGDFTWVDTGDTGSTLCTPWVGGTHTWIAAQNPAFVTHGGDISYANNCGVGAVRQYFLDQQAWSENAAFIPAWGNHEYGAAIAADGMTPPPGTPRDSMFNYKGRTLLPNAGTVPADGPNQNTYPGCGKEIGVATNKCPGDDWGWFVASHVMYISYPEPWGTNVYTTYWEGQAAQLMENAKNDPNIDYVVTYGHRPGISSNTSQTNSDVAAAISHLSQTYSPTDSNPSGKYILNLEHHVHNEEVFDKINGLVNIVNGGGGVDESGFGTPITGSQWRKNHPAILVGNYSAVQHSLTINIVCGPVFTPDPNKDPCTPGSSLYTQTFNKPTTPPAQAALTAGLSDGVTTAQVGPQPLTYTLTATNTVANSTASGVTGSITLPANVSIVNANGGTVNGNTVSWSFGDTAATPVSKQVVVQLQSGNPGDTFTATAALTTTDTSCQVTGSNCAASDSDTVAAAPTTKEWVGNQGFETNLTGWTGVYNGTSKSTRVSGGYNGSLWSLRSVNSASSTTATGFIDKPHWIDGTAGKTTVADRFYTGSVWVKADVAGEKITLYLRELTPSGVTVNKVPYNVGITVQAPNNTGWFNITEAYRAVNNGDTIGMYVYTSSVASQKGFNADMLSLTSPTN